MFRVGGWSKFFKTKGNGGGGSFFFKYSRIEGGKLLEAVVSTLCCRFADTLN